MKNKNSDQLLYFIVGLTALVLVVILGVIISLSIKSNLAKPDNNNQTKEVEKIEDKKPINEEDNQDRPKTIDEKNRLSGQIISKTINYKSLQIRTSIDQTIDNGSCNLFLDGPNNIHYETSAKIIQNSSKKSSCYGFDINLNDIERDQEKIAGEWKITINLTSGNKSGQIVDSINI